MKGAKERLMKNIPIDRNLIACCGLYCGACGFYLKGRCPGCRENKKAGWCKVKACCLEHNYSTCSECTEHTDPNDCSRFNNIISKLMSLIFNSNRKTCIFKIRELGPDNYAALMAERKSQTFPRKSGV